MIPVRAAATQVLAQILRQQGSLSSLLPAMSVKIAEQDRPLLQQLCFGVCRYYPQLQAYTSLLLDKPLRAKDSDVQALLLLGLYQLIHTRIPDHAAIGETVEVTRDIKKAWATKLVNGVLRQFQRDQQTLGEKLASDRAFSSNHPDWLEGMLRKSWPQQTDSLLAANNEHPPFTLRLNTRHMSRDDYLAQLRALDIAAGATPFSPYGITLVQACDPRSLPGFAQGLISVQDEAAQLSGDLLQLAPGLRVLDACCAPGGKTGHLLEIEPRMKVTAMDVEERRLQRVRDNLGRLGVTADIRCGDGTRPEAWWDGEPYDRILLDAPCSATGIIRRHPDIKVLRTPEEIARLAQLQGQLLDSLWPLLKPGGILLYATCSVMPRENTRVVEAFIQRQPEARCDTLDVPWGLLQPCGRQLLPQPEGHDGFYYARLRKSL
ncbi:16S rRNA (cytosine(967)-C(5))-methyltransferase RsmB [Cellvibrio japonicus]|uniref:16S rRNA (cytosine(967)-C(5))-methyltransferase n=1 Tax=Cellvibrio japonicus (strain Ueda107) TaxID=498211 RepID=B3PGY5_CELJU|nr:16S rRNA (cytosine(967)-C(5))-methyltransferase RsmB [Cellvibrio japonicus]ACE84794.1 ribosomal RNA small subunit methyltransferase B [Cellvibrio japonicus Ueda107]QEI13787.1 16S rRNA (cytosine(967)-C(5))-methyltransferase RsmB [Cellvibrio japonicus]QEI17361.1 16S rRNA (cytosine(967)-C(5))-methyltransferase RsmB [Cellvibrio japonicus]QEI20937.1 16S rRNA (cytosine(967)-C(5))-methyltransferase RsmB [Cellvibrio japonicus]